MPIDPEEVESKEFLVSLRGYDREEVDRFLSELADEIRDLKTRIAAAGGEVVDTAPGEDRVAAYRQVGEETSKILLAAEEAANEIRDKARRDAAEIVAKARGESHDIHRAARRAQGIAEDNVRKLKEAHGRLMAQLEEVRRRLDDTIARIKPPVEVAEVAPIPSPDEEKPAPPASDPVPKPEPEKEEIAPKPPVVTEVGSKPEPAPEQPSAAPAVVSSAPATVTEPVESSDAADTLQALLHEVREERERGREEFQSAMQQLDTESSKEAPAAPTKEAVAPEPVAQSVDAGTEALAKRDETLKGTPDDAARRLKRTLQEDQNDLLDKIRTKRGKGTFDDFSPLSDQEARFIEGLSEVLTTAYVAGRHTAGAADDGNPADPVASLVAKQLVTPLRRELSGAITAGLEAEESPTVLAERAGDVYRVWKGVRTDVLGEGLTFSAFHHAQMDQWRSEAAATKQWILADEEQCPNDVCAANTNQGAVAVNTTFGSGHLAPPAHGGCRCTLLGPQQDD